MVTSSDLRTQGREVDAVTRPDPRLHAEQILLWALCWPWNLLWTLIVHNPLRNILQFLVIEVRSTLEEISTGEFQQIERDLVIGEPLTDESLPASKPEPASEFRTPTHREATTPPVKSGPSASSTVPQPRTTAPVVNRQVPAQGYVPPPLPAHSAAAPQEDPWLAHPEKKASAAEDAWLQ